MLLGNNALILQKDWITSPILDRGSLFTQASESNGTNGNVNMMKKKIILNTVKLKYTVYIEK